MSSVRVESPLIQDYRRQPCPLPQLGAPRMSQSRARRQLFPVDHEETERYIETQLARCREEDRRKLGFDLDTLQPLPSSNQDGDSSRYTDWEAVSARNVPAFYHETTVRHKPHDRRVRPAPFSETTPSSNEGVSGPSQTLPTASNENLSTPHRTDQSQGVYSLSSPQDARSLTDLTSSTSCPGYATRRRLRKSASTGLCSERRDSTETNRRRSNTRRSRSLTSVTNSPGSSFTQSKVTDFMKQRKRSGSGSSASSVSSSDADGEKCHHVPSKRRHTGRSAASSPAVKGNL